MASHLQSELSWHGSFVVTISGAIRMGSGEEPEGGVEGGPNPGRACLGHVVWGFQSCLFTCDVYF